MLPHLSRVKFQPAKCVFFAIIDQEREKKIYIHFTLKIPATKTTKLKRKVTETGEGTDLRVTQHII